MSNERQRRQANNALGVAVLALMFLAEVGVQEYRAPNPATPAVFVVLGLAAAIGVLRYLQLRRRASAPPA